VVVFCSKVTCSLPFEIAGRRKIRILIIQAGEIILVENAVSEVENSQNFWIISNFSNVHRYSICYNWIFSTWMLNIVGKNLIFELQKD
jgi:hypothetical protein